MDVCGFSARERVLFLNTLMRFGPPYVHQVTELGWVPYEEQFPAKTRLQVRGASCCCWGAGPAAAAAAGARGAGPVGTRWGVVAALVLSGMLQLASSSLTVLLTLC